ncbi:hypothetical protein J6590_033019 [Homalodisca vitripennis]|nr:hypothetical protein J6590_033019 [Homalodisca vitripennis]
MNSKLLLVLLVLALAASSSYGKPQNGANSQCKREGQQCSRATDCCRSTNVNYRFICVNSSCKRENYVW